MKTMRYKTLLLALALGGTVLTACREDEELNLSDFPDSSVGIVIDGEKEGVSVVNLTGVYDHQGNLSLDGAFKRQYIFALSSASPEDLVLHVDLLAENIPADRISIDRTSVRIPVGERTSEPVTVSLVDEDFSFMQGNKEAMTYELGLKVTGYEGHNVSFEGPDCAKVVLEKEAYVANCSFDSKDGNTISFRRNYANGQIVNEEAMEHKFRMHLDRPADADVTIRFASAGLADRFNDDVTLTPATVTIPAGEVESEEITWTLKDDFLLTTDEPELHEVTLTASFESTDPTVRMLEGGDVLTFSIQKVRNILSLLDAPDASWTMYGRTGWTATGSGGSGTPASVLDGNTRTDYYSTSATMWISIDMQQERSIAGLRVVYYSASYYSTKVMLECSNDGQTWTEMGTLEDMARAAAHTIKVVAATKARYVRFHSLGKAGYYHDISEIEIYY